jgi:hypothetical protein
VATTAIRIFLMLPIITTALTIDDAVTTNGVRCLSVIIAIAA